MDLTEFDYYLPTDRIAQSAVHPKSFSKMLVVKEKSLSDKHFYDITKYMKKNDVLVVNESKVAKARITGKKETGTKVELILVKRLADNKYLCRFIGKNPRAGNRLIFDGFKGTIVSAYDEQFEIMFDSPNIVEMAGELPTPPYIKKSLRKILITRLYMQKMKEVLQHRLLGCILPGILWILSEKRVLLLQKYLYM